MGGGWTYVLKESCFRKQKNNKNMFLRAIRRIQSKQLSKKGISLLFFYFTLGGGLRLSLVDIFSIFFYKLPTKIKITLKEIGFAFCLQMKVRTLLCLFSAGFLIFFMVLGSEVLGQLFYQKVNKDSPPL